MVKKNPTFHIINTAIVNSYILYKENKLQYQQCHGISTMPWNSAISEEKLLSSSSTGGNISTPLGRPAPRVLERHAGRHFLDMQMEGEKPLHR